MSDSADLTEHNHQVEPEEPESDGSGELIAFEGHSGPLPHPAILAGYEQIVPGAAERIIQMAEKNQAHQIDMERGALNAARFEGRRGQVFALIVSLDTGPLLTYRWSEMLIAPDNKTVA